MDFFFKQSCPRDSCLQLLSGTTQHVSRKLTKLGSQQQQWSIPKGGKPLCWKQSTRGLHLPAQQKLCSESSLCTRTIGVSHPSSAHMTYQRMLRQFQSLQTLNYRKGLNLDLSEYLQSAQIHSSEKWHLLQSFNCLQNQTSSWPGIFIYISSQIETFLSTGVVIEAGRGACLLVYAKEHFIVGTSGHQLMKYQFKHKTYSNSIIYCFITIILTLNKYTGHLF